ncbi:TPA: EAL domain-containing protein [Photobacterium damselae]
MLYIENKNLQAVLSQQKIQPFFQEIIDSQGKTVGIEILSRWIDEDTLCILPEQFIQAFDNNGLLADLTCSIIEQVIKVLVTTPRFLSKDFYISINVTEDILSDYKFKYYVKYLSTFYNVILELSETYKIKHPNCLKSDIYELNSNKIKFAIDDYGINNSTLSMLYEYNFHVLKLDKFFVSHLFKNDTYNERNKKRIIIQNIVDLSKALNLKLIAEGIECIEQETTLKNAGVEYFQGYMYSKPMHISHILDIEA